MGKVIPMKRPIVVEGVPIEDAQQAMLAMLDKLADACRTIGKSGYRRIRITLEVRGVE